MKLNEIRRRFPNASAAFIESNLDSESSGPDAVMECNPCDAPLEAEKVQGRSGQKFLARFTSVRSRLLDESNLCYKYYEDLCRYSGALPDDSPEICHSEVFQRKPVKGEAEHTIIEIYEAILP